MTAFDMLTLINPFNKSESTTLVYLTLYMSNCLSDVLLKIEKRGLELIDIIYALCDKTEYKKLSKIIYYYLNRRRKKNNSHHNIFTFI